MPSRNLAANRNQDGSEFCCACVSTPSATIFQIEVSDPAPQLPKQSLRLCVASEVADKPASIFNSLAGSRFRYRRLEYRCQIVDGNTHAHIVQLLQIRKLASAIVHCVDSVHLEYQAARFQYCGAPKVLPDSFESDSHVLNCNATG